MATRLLPSRVFLIALIAALLVVVMPVSPVVAQDIAPETVSEVVEDLDVDGSASDDATVISEVRETEMPFNSIGVKATGDPAVAFRTRSVDGEWQPWQDVQPLDEEDGPDGGTEEALEAESLLPAEGWVSDAIWVGDSDHIQLRIENGDLSDVEVHTIDSMGLSETLWQRVSRTVQSMTAPAPAEASTYPGLVTRSQWGANESLRRSSPSYATVRFAVVHHTAGSNSYSRAEAPGVVRGIYQWHVTGNGWNDLGYNILVDRYGTVYEGRYGGLDRGVIGAHASGFNTGSFGISVMGNFDVAQVPAAAFNAVRDVMAWKYDVHAIDANPSRRVSVNGRTIPVMVGHRDVGSTACPGRYFAQRMDELRSGVAARAGRGVRTFTDVPANSRFENDIVRIAQAGITQGCGAGRFCPGRSVTREEMASFLVRALDLPRVSGNRFRDVGGGSTHGADVNALAAAGVTLGCNPPANDRFCPKREVTRAEMASFLTRGLRLRAGSNGFRDVSSSNRHRSDIGALARSGITRGCNPPTNDRFCPNRAITREEMAAFLNRAFL